MVSGKSNQLNAGNLATLPAALSTRSNLDNRTIFKSTLFVAGIFVALLVLGSVMTSGPSQATLEADRRPTSTTTTEPPPEGVVIVHIDNGVLRPSNLEIDISKIQTVKWINLDEREFYLEDADGNFLSDNLATGEEFEFDYSSLPGALYRYKAVLVTESIFGGVRIPGLVDTRAAQ